MSFRIGIGLLVLLALAFLMRTGWDKIERRNLEARIAELEASGFLASEGEWRVAEPPSDENAAPLLLEAMELARGIPAFGAIGDDRDAQRDAEGRFVDPLRHYVPAGREGELAGLDEVVESLARAAARPACVFPWQALPPFSPERSSVNVPDFAKASGLLAGRSILRARDGAVDAALAEAQVLARFAEQVRADPILILQLLGIHARQDLHRVLREVLPRVDNASATLARLPPSRVEGVVARALRYECSFAARFARDLDPAALIGEAAGAGESSTMDWLLRPWLRAQMREYLDFMAEQHRIAAEAPGRYDEAVAEVRTGIEKVRTSGAPLFQLLSIDASKLLEIEGRCVADEALLRLGAALLDHAREHGAYPATLEELGRPELLRDPYDGGTFELAPEAEGPVIRSASAGEVAWRLPPPPR